MTLIDVRIPETEPLLQSHSSRQKSKIREPPETCPTSSNNEFIGCVFQILGALAFSMCDVTIRYMQTRLEVPTSGALIAVSIVEIVGAIGYFAIFTSVRQVFGNFRQRDVLMLLGRGVAGSASMLCVFLSLQYLPVGVAHALFFIAPVMFLFVAAVALSEPITKPGIVAAVMGFVGVVLVSHTEADMASAAGMAATGVIRSDNRTLGTIYVLLGALSSCFVYITVRNLVRTVHFMTPVLSLGSMTLCVGLTMSRGGTQALPYLFQDGYTVMCGLGSGLFMLAGQMCLNYGMKFCKANTAFLVRNVQVLFTYVLAMIILDETPGMWQIAGSSLIVAAATMTVAQGDNSV